MRSPFQLTLGVLSTLAMGFLLIPAVAIFTRVSPTALLEAATSPPVVTAMFVSLKTSFIAHVFLLLLGTPLAYLIALNQFWGRKVVIALTELPLVLPPAVAGIGLLAAFGRRGPIGGALEAAGISISFTQTAVVIAITFVAAPLYIRQAVTAFEGIDQSLLDASRTLNISPWRRFWRIALPLAGGGLAAGSALAWARGLGEFGATIMFAGSLPGVTETLPLAIYSQLNRDFSVALSIGAIFVLLGLAVLVSAKFLSGWLGRAGQSQAHTKTA
ncbi:MAG: ABC transporter permease [Acidimicrobiia bacterium]